MHHFRLSFFRGTYEVLWSGTWLLLEELFKFEVEDGERDEELFEVWEMFEHSELASENVE